MDLIERTEGGDRRHPWEIARFHSFRQILQRQGVTAAPANWLDVGSGDAWLAGELFGSLPTGSTMTCWDINYLASDLVDGTERPDGLTLTPDRPSEPADGVLMLDVIEHVEDDLGFVKDIVDGLMKPGGWALVSVPAYQSLFTAHDVALKHYRRYSPDQCRKVLGAAGLRIEAQGGLFHSLLAVRGAQVLASRFSKPADESPGIGAWQGGDLLTRTLTKVLDAECRLSLAVNATTRTTVPGLSYWAFCRREVSEPT